MNSGEAAGRSEKSYDNDDEDDDRSFQGEVFLRRGLVSQVPLNDRLRGTRFSASGFHHERRSRDEI